MSGAGPGDPFPGDPVPGDPVPGDRPVEPARAVGKRPSPEETEASPAEEMAARIRSDQGRPLAWRTVVKRAIVVAVGGIALYLLFPSLIEVFGSFPRLSSLSLVWLAVAFVAQAAHFLCTFALQRMALRTRSWFPVVTAQLTGNAVTLIVPGGAAAGAGVQYRMLSTAGIDAGTAVGGLSAFSLLGVGGLLALPIFALPAILFGSPVSGGLVHAAVLGIVGFVLFAGFSVVVMATNRPLELAGTVVERVRNRLFPSRPPLEGLDHRLLVERDAIRAVLGQRWWEAVLLSAGRLGLDYLTLLACLRATGAEARPGLVLLAYAVAGVIGLIPITPGGLGIVEASLAGLLVLAGVGPSDSYLATLAYRLASYWVPLLAGPFAYLVHRRRYGPNARAAA